MAKKGSSASSGKTSLGVGIKRAIDGDSRSFKEVFEGFEKVGAVRAIFHDKTEEVLENLKVVFAAYEGYLHVDAETGSIVISVGYLKTGDERHLYLDVIHELVHIRQLMEGKELFDRRYSYVDRSTEIEAYETAMKEAERIGMSDEEITEYLRVEWVTEEEFQRLRSAIGAGRKKKKKKRKEEGGGS